MCFTALVPVLCPASTGKHHPSHSLFRLTGWGFSTPALRRAGGRQFPALPERHRTRPILPPTAEGPIRWADNPSRRDPAASRSRVLTWQARNPNIMCLGRKSPRAMFRARNVAVHEGVRTQPVAPEPPVGQGKDSDCSRNVLRAMETWVRFLRLPRTTSLPS